MDEPITPPQSEPTEPIKEQEPEVAAAPKTEPEPMAVAPAPVATPMPEVAKPSSLLSKPLEGDAKLFAAISYASVLFIVPWIVKKDDPYVAFHIKQGAGLFIAEAIVWVGLWLVDSFLTGLFSYHAAGLILWLNKLAWIIFVAFSIVGIYYALKGETKKLPYLDFIIKYIKL